MPFNHGYELTWETVAHALTKGLQLRTRGRLVEPSALTKAQNVEYPVTGGVQKRRGHTAARVKTAVTSAVPPTATDVSGLVTTPFSKKILPDTWLPGYGTTAPDHRVAHTAYGDNPKSTLSDYAQLALGGFALDSTPIVWTGDQLVSENGNATNPVLMPMAKTHAVSVDNSKAQYSQCARAPNGNLVVVTPLYTDAEINRVMRMTCYSPDGAILNTQDVDLGVLGGFVCLRVLPLVDDVWVCYNDSATSTLKFLKVTRAETFETPISFATLADGQFDIAVVPNPASVFAYIVYAGGTGILELASLSENMTQIATRSVTTPVGALFPYAMAVDVHPKGNVGVACVLSSGGYLTKAEVFVEMFPPSLATSLGSDLQGMLTDGVSDIFHENVSPMDTWGNFGQPVRNLYHGEFAKISIGFRALLDAESGFEEFIDVWASSLTKYAHTNSERAVPSLVHMVFRRRPAVPQLEQKDPPFYLPFCEVIGRAMSVGATPVVPIQWHGLYGNRMWSTNGLTTDFDNPVQPTHLLLGTNNKPVGKLNASTAFGSYHGFYPVWPGNYVYTGCLPALTVPGYTEPKQNQTRVPQLNTFRAPKAVAIDLDFVHPLETAQLGGSVFIAGAQVWEYDGRRLTEAGFHLAPEFNQHTSGVALAAPFDSPEFWRVDTFDFSESGELTRSASIPYKATEEVLGANNLSVWFGPTWRTSAGFSAYESSGGVLYRSTTRDPLEQPATRDADDSIGNATRYTIAHRVNSVLSTQEIHPASTIGYLQPNSPPACQLIRAGNSRLWFAGGSVPTGSVTTSLLYQPGYLPGWNDYNTQIVDTVNSEIADMAFLQDAAFIFTAGRVGIINSDGPDNFSQGSQWPQPRQLTVGGTPYPNTAIATTQGIFFLANSGMKLINYAGGISDVGDADPELFANNIVAAVNFASKDQARWYSSDGDAVVLDYREGRFSTWTGLECANAFVAGERAYVVKRDGRLWTEAYGAESVWQDAGASIEMVIRTAWNPMGTGEIGYGRCRRIAWTGEFRGDHNVRMRVFYNESAVHEDEYTLNWATQGSLATSWGSDFWGFGAWGGSSTDKIWRWARRPAREKCSVIMFELSDLGANSAGFVPVCYGFEIGRRGGLDRVRMK